MSHFTDHPTPIPPTSLSPLIYIGGKAALNISSEKGTGDWHMLATFFVKNPTGVRALSFISGEGCPTDTVWIFGDEGIYDCTEKLAYQRIPHEGERAYAASHARATADLVIGWILRGGTANFVCLDDWMPRDSDKQEVYDLIDKAMPHLNDEQQTKAREWLRRNPVDYDWGKPDPEIKI